MITVLNTPITKIHRMLRRQDDCSAGDVAEDFSRRINAVNSRLNWVEKKTASGDNE